MKQPQNDEKLTVYKTYWNSVIIMQEDMIF